MTLEKTVICTCIQKYLFHEYSRVTSYMADQNGFLIKVTYIRYCKSYVKSLYIFCIIASSSDVMSSHHYLQGNPNWIKVQNHQLTLGTKEEIAYFSSDTEIDYWYYL